jgi:hypothetical protein
LLAVGETAQSPAITDVRSMTRFPDCALKEPDPEQVPYLRRRAIGLATNRVRTPDQIAFWIDFGFGDS